MGFLSKREKDFCNGKVENNLERNQLRSRILRKLKPLIVDIVIILNSEKQFQFESSNKSFNQFKEQLKNIVSSFDSTQSIFKRILTDSNYEEFVKYVSNEYTDQDLFYQMIEVLNLWIESSLEERSENNE